MNNISLTEYVFVQYYATKSPEDGCRPKEDKSGKEEDYTVTTSSDHKGKGGKGSTHCVNAVMLFKPDAPCQSPSPFPQIGAAYVTNSVLLFSFLYLMTYSVKTVVVYP